MLQTKNNERQIVRTATFYCLHGRRKVSDSVSEIDSELI